MVAVSGTTGIVPIGLVIPVRGILGIEARSVVQRIFADIEIHELVDGGQIPAYFVRLHDVVAVQVAVTQQHSVQGVLVVIGQTVVLGGVEHLRPMQGSVGYIVFAQNTTYGIEPAVAGGSTVSHVTFLPTRALHAAFKPPCGGQFILALFHVVHRAYGLLLESLYGFHHARRAIGTVMRVVSVDKIEQAVFGRHVSAPLRQKRGIVLVCIGVIRLAHVHVLVDESGNGNRTGGLSFLVLLLQALQQLVYVE